MIPRQIFVYWEGKMPSYIKYCLSTFSRSGVKIIFLNPDNVDKYIGDKLCSHWRNIIDIAQKTDCIRIPVIYENGGMWVDADTIFIKDCKHLFEFTDEFIGIKWRSDRVLNGYFMAPVHNDFMYAALKRINEILKDNPKKRYDEGGGVYLGEGIFTPLYKKGENKIRIINRETFIPIEFPFNRSVWYEDLLIESFLKPETVCIALNHSQYPLAIVESNIDEFYKRKDLLGSIFRYSKSL